jgi:hypothetical protein
MKSENKHKQQRINLARTVRVTFAVRVVVKQ